MKDTQLLKWHFLISQEAKYHAIKELKLQQVASFFTASNKQPKQIKPKHKQPRTTADTRPYTRVAFL